jgi:hypothetical protein
MRFLILLLLVLPLTCFARLGENEQELIARYGEVSLRRDDVVSFEKNGFLIQATMIDGKAESIAYKNKSGAPLTGNQVQDFLQKNFPPPNNKLVFNKEETTKERWVFVIPNASAFYNVPECMLILITEKGMKTKIKEILLKDQDADRQKGL